jgi:hypothetical protein
MSFENNPNQTLTNEQVFHSLMDGRPVPPFVPPSVVPPPLPRMPQMPKAPQTPQTQFDPAAIEPTQGTRLVADAPVSTASSSPTADSQHVLQDIQTAAASAIKETAANVSKEELATILEGFAAVLRTDPKESVMTVAEHHSEVSQLKELLLEAQETIITLLNDRVFDRAKLARLECEVKLLPDLQAQAHRAMGLAMQSEEVQKELAHVRSEVERLRTSYMRAEQKEGWLSWLFKARGNRTP